MAGRHFVIPLALSCHEEWHTVQTKGKILNFTSRHTVRTTYEYTLRPTQTYYEYVLSNTSYYEVHVRSTKYSKEHTSRRERDWKGLRPQLRFVFPAGVVPRFVAVGVLAQLGSGFDISIISPIL